MIRAAFNQRSAVTVRYKVCYKIATPSFDHMWYFSIFVQVKPWNNLLLLSRLSFVLTDTVCGIFVTAFKWKVAFYITTDDAKI